MHKICLYSKTALTQAKVKTLSGPLATNRHVCAFVRSYGTKTRHEVLDVAAMLICLVISWYCMDRTQTDRQTLHNSVNDVLYLYILKKKEKRTTKNSYTKHCPSKTVRKCDRERAECNKRISNRHISHERWSSFVTCAKTRLISCQKACRQTRVSSGGEDIAHADNSIEMAERRRQTEELCFSPM